MYRLANEFLKDNKQLHDLAVFCLTETIRAHLKDYFYDDYISESDETLYEKVDMNKVYTIMPAHLYNEIVSSDLDYDIFIAKKFAQFMCILRSEDEVAPDIFIEYLLYRMIVEQKELGYDFIPEEVSEKKVELIKLMRTYIIESDIELVGIKDRNEYINSLVKHLTEFDYLYEVEGPYRKCFAIWNSDYMLFDNIGFIRTLACVAHMDFGERRGYGIEYTDKIFADVNEKTPYYLTWSFIRIMERLIP